MWAAHDDHNFEELMYELFRLHDLNKDGLLDELELVQLNKKIAVLHHGRDVDLAAVRAKYQHLFRTRLDPEGQPVNYVAFRRYMLEVVDALERSEAGQKMILEQFIVEAAAARAAFHDPSLESASDAAFLPSISFDEEFLCGPALLDEDLASPTTATATAAAAAAAAPAAGSCGQAVGRGVPLVHCLVERLPPQPLPVPAAALVPQAGDGCSQARRGAERRHRKQQQLLAVEVVPAGVAVVAALAAEEVCCCYEVPTVPRLAGFSAKQLPLEAREGDLTEASTAVSTPRSSVVVPSSSFASPGSSSVSSAGSSPEVVEDGRPMSGSCFCAMRANSGLIRL